MQSQKTLCFLCKKVVYFLIITVKIRGHAVKFISLFVCFLTVILLYGGEFRIAATADLHGDLRRLSCLAPQIRKANADILLDAGDLTGGNLVAELDGGSSMIEALNLLKYDFRIPGNHDFEMPQQAFEKQCRDFKGVTLGADWRWGTASGVLCKVVKKGSFKVGVIGLTEPDLQRRHLPVAEAPHFREWEKVLREALAVLRREKVHFTVLLWHNGVESRPNGAAQVLRRLPEIDLIIAAHSHQENAGLRIRNCYLVQPGAHGTSAALVTISYDDRSNKVNSVRSSLLRGEKNGAPDLAALAKRAVKPFYKKIFEKICLKGDLSVRNVPRLGAEALRRAGGTQGAVFVSFTPEKHAAGADKYKDLFRIISYRNTLCTVTLRKDELKALLTDLHKNNRKFKRVMGVAGFRWDPGSRKRPSRLESPPVIRITVSSYIFVSTPVLRSILREKTPRWQHTDIVEREAVRTYLLTRRSTSAVRQGR